MATRKKAAPAEEAEAPSKKAEAPATKKQAFRLLIRTDKTDTETLHSFEADNEHEAVKARDKFFAERGERIISCKLA